MNIFELNDYRQILRDTLLLKKEQHGRTHSFQTMATACRVQKAYLSKVLKGHGHLSDDQLYLATEFLKLSRDEREYVTLLHAIERCSVQTRKRELTQKLESLQRKNLQTDTHLTATPIPTQASEIVEYYLDPNMQLVHMFLSIESYAREPDKIIRDLRLDRRQLADVLDRLLRLGIIAYESGEYKVKRDNMHLPPGSRVYETYRTLMRMKTLEHVPRLPPEDTYNFSVVFSADDATRAAIQARVLELIRATEGLVRKAPQQQVFQMTLDLFKWSTSAK